MVIASPLSVIFRTMSKRRVSTLACLRLGKPFCRQRCSAFQGGHREWVAQGPKSLPV
jgi:hypothetical protein